MKTILWHLCYILLFNKIACSHFRGGTMSSKYNDEHSQMEITLQTFWTSGNDFCSGTSISCLNMCSYVYDNCTNRDFSSSQDWISGVKTFVYRDVQFVGEFSSCCWVFDIGAGSWGLKITSNSTRNSSPITKMLPIVQLQYGCGSTIKIPVDDSDGDVVTCRWAKAEQRECGDYCLHISGNINNCTLDIGSTGIGTYGIAIQIEDFQSRSSNVPLSSIPLQFILYVYSSTSPCSDLPRIIGTLPDNSYVPVLPYVTWSYNITAQSSIGSNITEIITVSPKGMTKSSILNGSSYQERYITLNWRPDYSLYGPNILCYAAVDNLRRMSAKYCLFMLVGLLPPVIGHVNSTSITVVWSRPPGKISNTYTLSYTYQGPCAGGGASGTKSIGNATQYTITELAPYTNYSIVVSAVNSNGAMGPYTSPLFVVTGQSAPGPVSGLQAINTTFTTITITWLPPPTPNGLIIMYQVTYSANGIVKTYNKSTPSVTLKGLVLRTTYTISVVGYTITGPGTPQQVQTSTAAIPNVTGVVVIATNITSVRVSWLAVQWLPQDGILTGYTVYYRSIPNTSKRQLDGFISQAFPPITNWGDITNLDPKEAYQFGVVAMVTIMGLVYSGEVVTSYTIIPGDTPTYIPVLVSSLVAEFVFLLVVMMIIVIAMVIYMRRRGLCHFQEPSNRSDAFDMSSKNTHSNHRDGITMESCEAYGDIRTRGQDLYEMVEHHYS